VSNFPEKAEEFLTMADDIEDNLMAKSQVTMVHKLELLSRGDELDSTRDNVSTSRERQYRHAYKLTSLCNLMGWDVGFGYTGTVVWTAVDVRRLL
jgi:hypothetical protein